MSVETEERTETRVEKYVAVVGMRCDLCGRPAQRPRDEDDPWRDHNRGYQVDRVVVKHDEGTCYPEGPDIDTDQFDVCSTCWKDKLLPWFAQQGAPDGGRRDGVPRRGPGDALHALDTQAPRRPGRAARTDAVVTKQGWSGFYGLIPHNLAPDPTPRPEGLATEPAWCDLQDDHPGDCHRVAVSLLLVRCPDGDVAKAKLCGKGADGYQLTRMVPKAKPGRKR